MARPRDPTSKLKLHGSYRKDRHGEREAEPKATGEPKQPADLDKWATIHWQAVVPGLVATGVAKHIDATALASMCIWWSEWKQLQTGEAGETDYKRLIQMTMCHKQWRDLASRFGLTPSDRANLTVNDEKPKSKLDKYIS